MPAALWILIGLGAATLVVTLRALARGRKHDAAMRRRLFDDYARRKCGEDELDV